MRILIAGLGSIGRRHLRALRSLGEKELLFLRTRAESSTEAPHVPVFTDLSSALAQGPELVIVSNPAPFHITTALAAARAGAHLFIEKPLADNIEGVLELRKVVEERELKAVVGFDLRFDKGLQKVHMMLEEGVIGRVLAARAEVGQYLPEWRPSRDYRETVTGRSDMGGGVLLELCHEFDYMDWLVGPIDEVACMAGKLSDLEIDVEDTARIVGRTSGGCLVTIELDCVQRQPCRRCKIIGSEGTIVYDLLERELRWIRAGETEWQVWSHAQDRDARFREQMSHVLACVRGDETPLVPLERGIDILAMTLAAKISNAKGITCKVPRRQRGGQLSELVQGGEEGIQ